MGSSNTESLLTAAGFRARTPQTPKQQQIYAALPPYQVQRATVNGKVFYVYKDEKAGVAYVGREQEYQRYQQLAIQQQIAQNQIAAAEMEQQAALDWSGGFGSGAFGSKQAFEIQSQSFPGTKPGCMKRMSGRPNPVIEKAPEFIRKDFPRTWFHPEVASSYLVSSRCA